MADDRGGDPTSELDALKAENARLRKTVEALMDRAERNAGAQSSDFGKFQSSVMLEEQIRNRTAKLEAALVENEKITHALRDSEARFRELVNQSLVGIAITEDGRFTYTNTKFNEMFGYTEAEVRNIGPLDVAIEEDRPKIAETIRQRITGETARIVYGFRGLKKDGGMIDVEIHASSMQIGDHKALISVLLDVTERVRAEREMWVLQQKLAEQSVRDALTGLFNRRHLEETLTRELILAERQGYPVSIIMSDIDHFKRVNDQFGHLAGDEVLRAFAALLKRSARASDIYCRYGGEEFLLVLPQMLPEKARARAEQLRRALAVAPVRYGATTISITASFGVAAYPDHGQKGERIIAAADKALYDAKASGRNCVQLSEAAAVF